MEQVGGLDPSTIGPRLRLPRRGAVAAEGTVWHPPAPPLEMPRDQVFSILLPKWSFKPSPPH